MENKYRSLRSWASQFKSSPNFKYGISAAIFRWAKDETLTLKEFAFLTKKALSYLKK